MARLEEINKDDLLESLKNYVTTTEIPIVSEFCYQYPISRQYLYELSNNNKELKDTIRNLIDKKESTLERKSLENKVNTTQAIFSLKQLGWKDSQQIDLKTNDFDITKLSKEELQEQIAKLEQK